MCPRDCSFNILVKNVTALCPWFKSLPNDKVKNFGWIPLAEEISNMPSIVSVSYLLVFTLKKIRRYLSHLYLYSLLFLVLISHPSYIFSLHHPLLPLPPTCILLPLSLAPLHQWHLSSSLFSTSTPTQAHTNKISKLGFMFNSEHTVFTFLKFSYLTKNNYL